MAENETLSGRLSAYPIPAAFFMPALNLRFVQQASFKNQYAYEVFKLPLSADSENNWAEYLRHKLVGTRYISPRCGAIDRHELYRDFCAYYPDFDGLPSMEQLSGAFNPNLPASHMRICMLTMFLQTDAFDLLKANAPIEPRTK